MRTAVIVSRAAVAAALIVGACVAAYPSGARADEPAVAGQLITAEATVEKIDTTRGTITLRSQQGKNFEVKAGPDVDLRKLHRGDRVVANYYEQIAMAIDPARQPATQLRERTIVRGGVAERQATVTARIVSVDAKKNTVTIVTPEGNTETLEVKDPALRSKLSRIKPGEHFDVTYTEALAIQVQPRIPAKP